ncbi:hypothetical protein J3P71_22700 [Rhizobium leguminosarum]|uniref:hypothetical protein n=1 Tax=Rhizobium leguminosarum TaxID=384 RepID=UPI00144285E5|nr:hypothetical protein [Rhizobium leguminosarum]MBY5838569.1 hypothetical protein [Rhizobium leguminosarum]NKM76701.1 hypothetical protein [Rhizobium leguminosarum bv. viciae]QSZ07589.1 hypothetical protein J3P71_22700 [Rhizobium leguminosarum]
MRMILAAIGMAFATAAHAHHAPSGFTYERYCCNGDGDNGDCQRISSKTVHHREEGYEVTLLPGDHRLATRRHVFLIPQAQTRESPDGSYHLCLFPNEDTVRCFYAPPMGF